MSEEKQIAEINHRMAMDRLHQLYQDIITKLEAENARLREALEKIAYHEGHMILDISRNKAVEGYRNNLHVAKQALKGRWK